MPRYDRQSYAGYSDEALKGDLSSSNPQRQTLAIRQVIASMTIGKDMSQHFTDVARCVASHNLEVKKLAYLYLMQNAKTQPEKAVLQSGVFVKDTRHESPLIRGIALRTMTSMLVPAMVDYATAPIVACLRDTDPYVRRTAACSVLKLWHLAPNVAQESGALQLLVDLLGDGIAAVVAAAVCSICEILTVTPSMAGQQQQGGGGGGPQGGGSFEVPSMVANALVTKMSNFVTALGDATEWPQMYLLEAIANSYPSLGKPTAEDLDDHEMLVGRVIPLLQSSNPAVVLNAVRVIVAFISAFCSAGSTLTPAAQAQIESKYFAALSQPMISLVTTPMNELRFVAFRTLQLILQRHTESFVSHVSSVLVKYDDPIYIKLQKIEVMIALATKENGATILSELVEYATEIDVELVRKSVRCIGILAVKVEPLAAQCVMRLIKLIESRINYVVQEAAVVVQTILRQYPNRFESVIEKLCSALDVLDDAASKAAVAWVVGEYADRVANTADILALFFDAFDDEPVSVQLSVLTASVKAFLKCGDGPDGSIKATLERCIGLCTASSIPDVRDRGYFYWRLVMAEQGTAAKVIMGRKEPLVSTATLDKALRQKLMLEAGCLSSVMHKPAELIVGDGKRSVVLFEESDDEMDLEEMDRKEKAAVETINKIQENKEEMAAVANNQAMDAVLGGAIAGGVSGAAVGGGVQGAVAGAVVGAVATKAAAGGGGLDFLDDAIASTRSTTTTAAAPSTTALPSTTVHQDPLSSILGGAGGVTSSTTTAGGSGGYGLPSATSGFSAREAPMIPIITNEQQGLTVSMSWQDVGATVPTLAVEFKLSSTTPLASLAIETIQLNVNVFCIGIGSGVQPFTIKPGQTSVQRLGINFNNQSSPTTEVQFAMKTAPLGVLFSVCPPVPLAAVLAPATTYDGLKYVEEFKQLNQAWSMPAGTEIPTDSSTLLTASALKLNSLYLVHCTSKDENNLLGLHIFASTRNGLKLYSEVTVEKGTIFIITVRCSETCLAPLLGEYLMKCLGTSH